MPYPGNSNEHTTYCMDILENSIIGITKFIIVRKTQVQYNGNILTSGNAFIYSLPLFLNFKEIPYPEKKKNTPTAR